MNTLYLTTAERSLYESLSEAVRDGWETVDETLTYNDNPKKQMLRLSLVRLHDPSLVKLRDKAIATSTPEEMTTLLQSQDLSLVGEDDLAQLCFALGPAALGRLIEIMLKDVSNDKDMEGVTALTVIRHSILASFQRP